MRIFLSVLGLVVIGLASLLLWTSANATPPAGTRPGVTVTDSATSPASPEQTTPSEPHSTPTETRTGPGSDSGNATPSTPAAPAPQPAPVQSAAPGPQPIAPVPVDPDDDPDDPYDDPDGDPDGPYDDGDGDNSDSGVTEPDDE